MVEFVDKDAPPIRNWFDRRLVYGFGDIRLVGVRSPVNSFIDSLPKRTVARKCWPFEWHNGGPVGVENFLPNLRRY